MKSIKKISFILVFISAALSFSSCSVEYRARHPRPVRHRRVIVVGKADGEGVIKTDTSSAFNENATPVEVQ